METVGAGSRVVQPASIAKRPPIRNNKRMCFIAKPCGDTRRKAIPQLQHRRRSAQTAQRFCHQSSHIILLYYWRRPSRDLGRRLRDRGVISPSCGQELESFASGTVLRSVDFDLCHGTSPDIVSLPCVTTYALWQSIPARAQQSRHARFACLSHSHRLTRETKRAATRVPPLKPQQHRTSQTARLASAFIHNNKTSISSHSAAHDT